MCFFNHYNESKLDLPEDFNELCNKNILLTGAGFSKDFGGLLAEEITYQIYNDESINRHIKNLIIEKNCNYEAVYDSIDGEELDSLNKVLEKIFKEIDSRIIQFAGKRIPNIDNFMGFFHYKNMYNFIITLNHDLLLERDFISRGVRRQYGNYNQEHYTADNADENAQMHFPYIDYSIKKILEKQFTSSQSYALQYQNDYHFNDFAQKINYVPDKRPIKNFVNYLKLHGSSSWNDEKNRKILIAGINKNDKISISNGLNLNMELFNKLCRIEKINIVIIGYSFRDDHINEHILNAAKCDARLYIVNKISLQDFSHHVKASFKDNSEVILSSIENYYKSKFTDFLNSDNFNILKKSISQ